MSPPQPQIQQLTPSSLHGEGPHWDCGQNMLYYVDISGQMLHRYDPATKDLKAVYFGREGKARWIDLGLQRIRSVLLSPSLVSYLRKRDKSTVRIQLEARAVADLWSR